MILLYCKTVCGDIGMQEMRQDDAEEEKLQP